MVEWWIPCLEHMISPISWSSWLDVILLSANTCTVKAIFPGERVQMCKSCTDNTPGTAAISCFTFSVLTPFGLPWKQNYKLKSLSSLPSIKILKISLKINSVVPKTRTEKKKVQIGSAMRHWGRYQISAEATKTPADWIKSPMTWIKAARRLISSCLCSCLCFCSCPWLCLWLCSCVRECPKEKAKLKGIFGETKTTCQPDLHQVNK